MPLAVLVARRMENEGRHGGGAAAWTIGLSAGLGALVGVATCN